MKLAYLAPSVIPSRSANSIHVMRMCQALAKNGHEVTLYVPKRQGEEETGVADVFAYYGVSSLFTLRYVRSVRVAGHEFWYGAAAAWQAKKDGAEYLYSRDALGAFMGCNLALPTIYEAHQPVVERGGKAAMFRLLSKHPKLKRWVVISDALRRMTEASLPEVSTKLCVAHDGADPVTMTDLPIDEGRLQVGYVGHLYQGRGIDLMLALAKRCPWAMFHLIGGMPDDIVDWKRQAGSLNNILFHGFVPPSESLLWQRRCHVLLAPYQAAVHVPGGMDTARWMSPLKIFEYMAAGRAIIASDLPILHEVLQENVTALFCDPQDVNHWAEALQKLRDDVGLRTALGRQAQARFDAQYRWDARARAVMEGL